MIEPDEEKKQFIEFQQLNYISSETDAKSQRENDASLPSV